MAGQLTIDTLRAGSGVLATQNGMTGIAKAWVNFNGVTTVTINGSFNVSSVTRAATGQYAINFTTAMPNANYSMVALGSIYSGGGASSGFIISELTTNGSTLSRTTSAISILALNATYNSNDILSANVTINGA
jgi:hypothetical protein